jgi:hypothetical protein
LYRKKRAIARVPAPATAPTAMAPLVVGVRPSSDSAPDTGVWTGLEELVVVGSSTGAGAGLADSDDVDEEADVLETLVVLVMVFGDELAGVGVLDFVS